MRITMSQAAVEILRKTDLDEEDLPSLAKRVALSTLVALATPLPLVSPGIALMLGIAFALTLTNPYAAQAVGS